MITPTDTKTKLNRNSNSLNLLESILHKLFYQFIVMYVLVKQ